ncbi:hypothetical protein ACWDRB_60945 [Nonomuraea sp. NPDC003707]
MSPTPAFPSASLPAAGTRHSIDPRTPSTAGSQRVHLVRLRPDDLPELVSVPLARNPSGTNRLIDGLDQVARANPPQTLARAIANAEHRMHAILAYLWDRDPVDALTPDALVEHDLQHGGRSVHTGLRLDDTTRYVWTRGTPPPTALHALEEITVLDGVCLGSAGAVMGVTASSRRVPLIGSRGIGITEDIIALEHDPRPTLSEHESVLRLIPVCVGLARRIPTPVPVTLSLDSPYLSYPVQALAAAYEGRLPVRLLAAWFDIALRLHHRVTRRQISVARAAIAGSRPLRIQVRPELWRVALYLRRELAGGRLPTFDHLLDKISQSDRLWQLLMEIARPSNPLELSYLLYVAAQWRAAWSTPDRPRLLVQVEDPREWRIMDRARQLERQVRHAADEPVSFSGVALYPLNHFWIQPPDGPARPDPHRYDPGHVALRSGQPSNLLALAADTYAVPARARTR